MQKIHRVHGSQDDRSGLPSNGHIWENYRNGPQGEPWEIRWGIGYYHDHWQIFWKIDECIQYADDVKQPYTEAQIIKNSLKTVLYMGLYTELRKIFRNKLSSWEIMGWLQEVLCGRVSWSLLTATHQHNPSEFLWIQHGYHNASWDCRGTGKPGRGHNFRKICTRPVN